MVKVHICHTGYLHLPKKASRIAPIICAHVTQLSALPPTDSHSHHCRSYSSSSENGGRFVEECELSVSRNWADLCIWSESSIHRAICCRPRAPSKAGACLHGKLIFQEWRRFAKCELKTRPRSSILGRDRPSIIVRGQVWKRQ